MLASGTPDPLSLRTLDDRVKPILETLTRVCPDAAAAFYQGLTDVGGPDRASWRGTVVEFREALRVLLDVMAPDDEVKKQPWYVQDRDAHGPTMKQKARFILASRNLAKPLIESFGQSVDVVEASVSGFIRSAYSSASCGTHTSVTRKDAARVREFVTLALAELLAVG
jgi:hypothetical protein